MFDCAFHFPNPEFAQLLIVKEEDMTSDDRQALGWLLAAGVGLGLTIKELLEGKEAQYPRMALPATFKRAQRHRKSIEDQQKFTI